MNSHTLENPFARGFRTSSIVFVAILAASLSPFISPLVIVIPLAAAGFLWVLFRYPLTALGGFLAFMPVDYMAIELGKFAGLPHMSVVSACTKEVPFLLLTLILWRRNGFTPAAPDWFLLACSGLAAVYTAFGGSLTALVIDFNFIIPYFLGRMTVLSQKQEQLWARWAVWIAASVAVLGLIEVWILGEGPRTILYLATDSETEGGHLTGSFSGSGFSWMREAATMVGPNGFGALCMIALILWWVYFRNPLPGGMIAIGLVFSVTRSAWLGAAVAIPLLAFLMDQKKRLFLYAALGLALFVAAIPMLDLNEYLANTTKAGQDSSVEGHQQDIVDGLHYAAEHPLGSGNQKASTVNRKGNANSVSFETTYVSLAVEYGIPDALCFVGFVFAALYLVWRQQSPLAYAAVGILVGLSLVMVVTLPLVDRRLACWAMFPVGLAIRAAREDSPGAGFPPSTIPERS
jgi:hypothetical protein